MSHGWLVLITAFLPLGALSARPVQTAEGWNNLGVQYFQSGDFQRAAEAFAHAAELRPRDGEIEFNLGLAYYKAGEPARAIPHLTAARGSSHRSEAHLLLGTCYFSGNQWRQAIAELNLYRGHDPHNAELLFLLEHAYTYVGDAKSSLAAATDLLKSHPDSPFTHEMLGEAYDRDGDGPHAIEELKLAVARSPRVPQLNFMLGYVYWRWKRYAEAVGPLEEEARINPRSVQPYLYLGDIALRGQDANRAARFFEKALALDPSSGEANLGMGKAYIELGKLDAGIAALRKAELRLTQTPEVHYRLARALEKAGRAEESQKEVAIVKALSAAQHRQAEAQLNGVPVGEILRAGPSN